MLTTAERYFLRAEMAGGSLVFSARCDWDGLLDANVMRQAVNQTLSSHPLLSSIVEDCGKEKVWRQVVNPDVFHHYHEAQINPPDEQAPPDINLRCVPGLKVELITSQSGQSRLRLIYHHACTDGQGGARFLRDVTANYAAFLSGTPVRCATDLSILDHRGKFVRPVGQPPIGLFEGLRNLWVTVRGKTERFDVRDLGSQGPRHSVVIERVLDRQLIQKVNECIGRRKLVMNDFALAATFVMLSQSLKSKTPGGYLTLLNPVDLRTWADRRSPASNRVGFAYIRRRRQNLVIPALVLESVAKQLNYVRQRGVAAELFNGIRLVERYPTLLDRIERSGRFVPTATLTCLSHLQLGRRYGLRRQGDQWALGDAVVRNVACVAPLPPGVPLAITIVEANGEMSITMRGASKYFNAPQLQDLFDAWCDGCEALCR
jgi:hypothetical protein